MKPQALDLVRLFEQHDNRMTLHEILQTHLSREFSARMAELRAEGYRFECVRAKKPLTPMDNAYVMTAPAAFDLGGQGLLIPDLPLNPMRAH